MVTSSRATLWIGGVAVGWEREKKQIFRMGPLI